MVWRWIKLGYIWTWDEERKAVGGDVTQVCTSVLRSWPEASYPLRFNPTHPQILYAWDISTSSGEPFAKYRFVNGNNEGYVPRWKIASLITDLDMSLKSRDDNLSVFNATLTPLRSFCMSFWIPYLVPPLKTTTNILWSLSSVWLLNHRTQDVPHFLGTLHL